MVSSFNELFQDYTQLNYQYGGYISDYLYEPLKPWFDLLGDENSDELCDHIK